MDRLQRHAATRLALPLALLVILVAPPAAAPAQGTEAAADQYRAGVAGSSGSANADVAGGEREAGLNAADVAAAATAPDFNVARSETDGGAHGGLGFLAVLAAGFVVAVVMSARGATATRNGAQG